MIELEFRYKWLDENEEGKLETKKFMAFNTREDRLDNIMQDFRSFLLVAGFHPNNISEYIEAN